MVGVDPGCPRIRDTIGRERGPLLAILATWGLAIALVGLGPNVPLQDDWTYAWSVEHLLKTGRFDVLQWSLHFPVFQTFWAAGFALIFGFSFTVLRASTLVLAVVATSLLYLTLRELEVNRRASLVAALTFALNPIVFFLSFTFMTDVPLYCLTTIAVFAFTVAHTRQRPFWIWVGTAASVGAFLARQIGIVTPVMGLPLVVAAWPDWRQMSRRALPLAVAWGVMAVSSVALTTYVGTTSYMLTKLESLQWLLLVTVGEYFNDNLWSLVQGSFALLPFLVAVLPIAKARWRVWAAFTTFSLVVLMVRFGHVPTPLTQGDSWSLVELGSSLALMPGGPARDPAGWFDPVVRGIGLLAVSALLTMVWVRLRAKETIPVAVSGVGLLLLVHVLEFNVLWLYSDRYVMMMLPLVIILLAWTSRHARLAVVPCVAVLIVWAAIDVVGTRYAMRVNDVAMRTWHEVNDAGVPAWDIDAGYAINGWMLYAHPERLGPGMDPERDVPFITADRTATWLIAHTPVDGYEIVRQVSWPDLPWPRRHRLYVLRKTASEPGAR